LGGFLKCGKWETVLAYKEKGQNAEKMANSLAFNIYMLEYGMDVATN